MVYVLWKRKLLVEINGEELYSKEIIDVVATKDLAERMIRRWMRPFDNREDFGYEGDFDVEVD